MGCGSSKATAAVGAASSANNAPGKKGPAKSPPTEGYDITVPASVKVGQAVSVFWEAPEDHHEQDYIGLYTKDQVVGCIDDLGKLGKRVDVGSDGGVLMFTEALPEEAGAYVVRYHWGENDAVIAARDMEIVA